MSGIRTTDQHPTFIRLRKEIEEKIHASTGLLTRQLLRMDPSLMLSEARLASAARKAETAMRNRLYKENGLRGKYVGH